MASWGKDVVEDQKLEELKLSRLRVSERVDEQSEKRLEPLDFNINEFYDEAFGGPW